MAQVNQISPHHFQPEPGVGLVCAAEGCGLDRGASVHFDPLPDAPTPASDEMLGLVLDELRGLRADLAPLGGFLAGLASFQPSGPLAKMLGLGGPPGG